MKAIILTLFAALACAGLAAAAPVGKVLILDNELLLEGDIRQQGDKYIVRNGMGETTFPATQVIDLVADRKQAYQVMSRRCNRRDYDDRVRLVHWCMDNHLDDEALAEAELLLTFRPKDEQILRIAQALRMLKTKVAQSSPPSAAAPKPVDKVLEVEPLDYNREAFGTFVSKVQPILMNACARCHASGQGGSFELTSVFDGGTRKTALFNLAATLKQLKRNDLANSPLLLKSITAHGKSPQAPFRDRQALAFQNLETWVQTAVAPEEPEPPVAKVEKAEAVGKPYVGLSSPTPLTAGVVSNPSPPTAGVGLESPTYAAPKTAFGETSTSKTHPEVQTEAKDPFDPAIFNGTIQPKK
jgi:hypothetical protein